MNHPRNDLPYLSSLAVAVVTLVGGAIAIAGTAAYRGVILGDGPIVYYELDETSGTTAVNSATTGATYTGTFNTSGGSVTVNQASFPQGGTAYDFGGGFVGSASALTNSLDEWTVEAWVNYDSAKTSQSNFLSNDQGGWNDDVLIGIGAETGNVGVPAGSVGAIQQGNPGSTRDAAGAPLVAHEWHHVVVTGGTSAGALTLYVDGVEVASDTALVNGVTFNGADGIGTANLTIGAARPNSSDGGYRPYDGLLDEVAVYDKVLDATTITNHYNAGSSTAGVPPVIVALIPADDASGAEIPSNLVATFSEPVVLTDNGTVTIRNLTLGSGSDVTIGLPDTRVAVSASTLTITPTATLDPDTSYAVRITGDAIEDADGDAFAGLLDDDGWNFMTAPLPGLVGRWEFESEAGGLTPDSSGNGHDGTLEGNANLTVDAERGSVLELSGLGVDADAVNIDSTVEIPTLPADRGVTLAAWIKRNADASAGDIYSYVIGLGSSGNFPIATLGISDSTGLIRAFIEGDGGSDQVDVDGDTVVSDGVWTHIAVTFDRQNNEAVTYVNGVAQVTPTDISVVGDGALDWGVATIGRRGGFSGTDGAHFGGLVDDVYYYDEVLTPEEIQALATGLVTFATWIGGFDVGGLDGFQDDPDGDGQGNGLENFFGTDPGVFSSGVTAGTLVGGNTFGFTHPQNAAPADDITDPAYRWSKDLLNWYADGAGDGDGTTVDFDISVNDPVDGTTTVLAEISGTATPKLFMSVSVDQILPPPPVFEENFDATTAGSLPADWTSDKNPADNASTTNWELGTPANVGPVPPGVPLPSGDHCVATDIDGNYDDPVSDLGIAHTDIWLRSPAIDLGAANSGILRFKHWTQIEQVPGDLDYGSIRILDASDDSELAVLDNRTIDGSSGAWQAYARALPAAAFTATAGTIKVEFRFEADDIDSFAGWYIDDVEVTLGAP